MFTEEQIAALKKLIEDQQAGNAEDVAKLVDAKLNAAIKDHLGRNEKKQSEAFKKTVDDALGAFAQQLAENQPAKGSAQNDPKDDANSELQQKVAKQDKQIADLIAQREADRVALEQTTKKAREDKAFADLKVSLGGVKDEYRDMLISAWRQDGRVSFDDDGAPTIKVRKALAKGLAEEETTLPLAEGIKVWLASKEAEAFLPPPRQAPVKLPSGPSPYTSLLQTPQGNGQSGPRLTDEQKAAAAADIAARIRANGANS